MQPKLRSIEQTQDSEFTLLSDKKERNPPFSVQEMRLQIADLFKHNPKIFWTDLAASSLLGWSLFTLAFFIPMLSFSYMVFSALSALALYRCWAFTHELAHLRGALRRGEMPGFESFWHIVAGIPLLTPGFMYHEVHLEHHNAHKYSRANDAEYLPFGAGSPWNIIFYPLVVWPMPLMAAFRFSVLSILSLVHPRVRYFIRTRASAAGMVPSHIRRSPRPHELLRWNIQESVTAICCITVIALTIAGVIPSALLFHWWFVMALFLTVNYVRALTAHRYENTGDELSFHDQFLDSVNVTGGGIITELWAPVGTRYHALHHLFPGIPYHSLAEAHNRLVKNLPKDHPYHSTIQPSLWSALRDLWKNAWQNHLTRS